MYRAMMTSGTKTLWSPHTDHGIGSASTSTVSGNAWRLAAGEKRSRGGGPADAPA